MNVAITPIVTQSDLVLKGCSELENFILVNVKKVSDVGVRYLAEGCSRLRYLNGTLVHPAP